MIYNQGSENFLTKPSSPKYYFNSEIAHLKTVLLLFLVKMSSSIIDTF